MRSLHVACCCLIAAIVIGARSADAELLIGDYRGPAAATSVYRYGDLADGAAVPDTSFYTNGGTGSLVSADSMTFDSVENVVYVADFWGQAIRVYPNAAGGNATPLRTLNPAVLGQPRQIAVSLQHDELIVANTVNISTYLRFANGTSVYPQRILPSSLTEAGSRTRLNNPGGVVLRAVSDEIVVPDQAGAAGATNGIVLFFSRAVTGNSAPYRVLEGPQTLLGLAGTGITYDDINDELIVLSQDSPGFPASFRINTFAGSASGNAAPLRSIAGALTQLDDVHSIHYDAAAETLYVSAGGEGGIPSRVLAFGRDASGNVAPERVILPTAGSFVQPAGIATTCDCIFRNGFNG